jgi:hypothetical protein
MSRSKQIKENMKHLQVIALPPKLWTDEDFYNEMIKEEEEKKAQDWTNRVYFLKEVLKRMKTMEKIQRTAAIEDLFPELRRLKDEFER